jgi:hypothetical protein
MYRRRAHRKTSQEHFEALITVHVDQDWTIRRQLELGRWSDPGQVPKYIRGASFDVLIHGAPRKCSRGALAFQQYGDNITTTDKAVKIDLIEEEEEEDRAEPKPVDRFVTKFDESKISTIPTEITIPGTSIEADAFGLIEGAVAGGGNAEFLAVTEGAWEGIGAGAFEGAAEGEIPIQLVQDITAPADLDILGQTEETTATIPRIEIDLQDAKAITEWTMIPRYAHIPESKTEIDRELRWSQWLKNKRNIRPGEPGVAEQSEMLWVDKEHDVGFIWLMKAPWQIKETLDPWENIDEDVWMEDGDVGETVRGNKIGGWSIDKKMIIRGKKISLKAKNIVVLPGEILWMEIWWKTITDTIPDAHYTIARKYLMTLQGKLDWGFY